MFIDTHVHLNNKDLYAKIDEVIIEANNVGVNKFFVVGYDYESSQLAIEIAKKNKNCFAIIGFHPTEIKNYTDKEYEWLYENAKEDVVVAIGEIGYDFHWDTTTKEEQYYAFVRQIEIAKKVNKPISIHSREGNELTLKTLIETNAKVVGGVMHSYSGSKEMAKLFIKENFYLGISGPVTFKNGRVMKEVVEEIDLKYLLSETDSPYLTPHPYRGKENGPKYIPLIVQEIANIKKINLEDVEKQIEINVQNLFGV